MILYYIVFCSIILRTAWTGECQKKKRDAALQVRACVRTGADCKGTTWSSLQNKV